MATRQFTSITYELNGSLNVIVFDAATLTTHSFQSEVTEHPIEKGANISDHVFSKVADTALEVLISDHHVTQAGGGIGGSARIGNASKTFETLLQLKNLGTLVTLENGLRVQPNMVIASVSHVRASTLRTLKVSLVLRSVTVAESRTATIARVTDPIAQKKTSKGKQQTTNASAQVKSKSWTATVSDFATKGLKQIGPWAKIAGE